MNSANIAELFEQLAQTDVENCANVITMRRLIEEFSKKLTQREAQTLVAATQIEVSAGFPETHKEEFERCIIAFTEISIKAKNTLEKILGDKWEDAIKANPLTFKINI